MKSKLLQNKKQFGFTLVELLVVMSIMIMISLVLILDFNRQRASRNITIAKNETVTNIRKVQSYMFSSRDISAGLPAKYYIVQFNLSTPTEYKVQAIDRDYGFHDDLETIKLPNDVAIVGYSDPEVPVDEDNCMQVLFSAPLGAMYIYRTPTCGGTGVLDIVQNPVALAQLSPEAARLYFAPGKYVQISPLTGQVSAQ